MRTVRWNGDPLHEATSAIVKESMNGDFILTVKYPISDTGIYKRIKEDMLIKCPTPVLGPQLFRIKKPVENNDQLEITAYHITDDIMQRSVKPVQVANQTCSIALSQMVQNAKTDLGDFSFTSDIQDRRTFNMTETENIYSVLLDGKHSIVGTWEGELVRDNFSLTVKKNRGENRGVVITTHKNLKSYQRSKNSQNVITRIHARSTFKPEGSEHETTIKVTVDSPLINSYPYINEKEYENNNLKTVEDLKKWAQAKFTNEGIDKVSDSIKLEAYELDGQVVHLGDTVNLKSLKHNVDILKKAIAYEYDGLKEEYISLEFDDKPGFGGSGVSNGLSNVASTIIGATYSAQEIAIERAARNADLAFEQQSSQLKKEVEDGIELIKAKAEENKKKLSEEINRRFQEFNPSGFEEAKAKAEEALQKVGANADLVEEAKRIAADNARDLNAFKTLTQKEREKLSDELKRYSREESENKLTEIREVLASNYVSKRTYVEDAEGTRQRLEAITKDNKSQLAEYKQTVDGQFTSLSSQVANKVDRLDFQQVKETSLIYERILGRTDSNVASNIARMALTSELFEVEVGKRFSNLTNLFYAPTKIPKYISSVATDKHLERVSWGDHDGIRINYTDSMSGWLGVRFPLTKKFVKQGESLGYRIEIAVDKVPRDGRVLIQLLDNTTSLGMYYNSQITLTKTGNQVFTGYLDIPRSGELNEYSIRFTLTSPGNIVIHKPMVIDKRIIPEEFVDSTDYNNEYNRVTMSLLQDSFAIKALNSAGDIIAGINVGANGNNRIVGKATHISGETLIDNAVIKSAMIDKLKTANFEAGSVTTTILGAEAVTAEKLKVDQAFFNKLVANEAYLSQLFAKQAFINRVQSVAIDASQVRSGILSGDRIYGGMIRGANIFGGTLTGHTKIQLGTYGSFDVVNGGLQINVPRDSNAKDGVGVQFIGSSGRGENVPYGLFVYKDDDITRGNTARDTDEFVMTVQGYINTKGIGWLKTGKGKVGSVTTGTLGFWQSTVALEYAPNDIYYTYNGTAYSLWAIIKQSFSDKRLKENIVDCKHKALDYIQRFQFKEYDWKKQEDRPRQAHTKIGLIAQEVQAVDPTLVYDNGDTLNLDNIRLTNIALKAIQELALENKKIIKRLENLENERTN